MPHLSQSGGSQAERYALLILEKTHTFCVNESNCPGYREYGRSPIDDGDRMGALLSDGVGFKPSGAVLKYDRQDATEDPTYRLFADMGARASEEQAPLGRTQWRIWRQLLILFRLSEVTDIRPLVALISRFGSRGIRPHPRFRPN